MKYLKTTTLVVLSLSMSIVLASCSSTSEEAATSAPTVSSSPIETPGAGSSGEISTEDTETDLVTSSTAPDWAADTLKHMPAGEWEYASNGSQVIASTKTFNSEQLQAFNEALLAEGWTTTLPVDTSENGYVTTLVNYSTGGNITIIGMEKAIPDANGTLANPATSIIFSK